MTNCITLVRSVGIGLLLVASAACGDDDTILCGLAADGRCPAGCPADPDCIAGVDMGDVDAADMGGGGEIEFPPELPGLMSGGGGAADLECRGTRTAPMGGDATDFDIQVCEFRDSACAMPIGGLCVKVFEDNMIDLAATCDPGTDYVTDDTGTFTVNAAEGSWYSYRVYPSPSDNIVGSMQINQTVPAGGTVEGTSVAMATIGLIPLALAKSRAPGTALIAGTALGCDGAPLTGAFVVAYDENGARIPPGAAAAQPQFNYFNGSSFPLGSQQWTNTDGLFLVFNVPVSAAGKRITIELWAKTTPDGEPEVIGCEQAPILPNSVSIVNIGPTRADGPACPGA